MALYVGLRGYPSRDMAARLTCFDTGWRFESGGLSGPSKMNFAPSGLTGLLFG
jgi:hypothetical protein